MGSEKERNGSGEKGIDIPETAKKAVQSIKEIVKNCTEQEIYVTLRDCNMNPDEAVHRLLSQDTFHEVKSKRERRKEMKETQESRFRGNSGLSQGVKVNNGECNVGWSGPTQISYNELGKAAYKGENESVAPPLSSSVSNATVKTMYQQPLPYSDSLGTDNRRQSIGTGDPITASVQLSPGFQPAWSRATTGHFSMADIVRMGRPHNRGTQMSTETSYTHQDAGAPNPSNSCAEPPQVSAPTQPESHQDLRSENPSNVWKMMHEPGITAGQHVFHDEQATANSESSSGASDTDLSSNCSYLHDNRANLFRHCQTDVVQVSEGGFDSENHTAGGTSHCDNDLLKGVSSNNSHISYDYKEDVSSAATTLQRLSSRKEEPAVPPTENHPVVFPNHLQALATDCLHLSFGTYKSGNNSEFSGPLESNSFKLDLEEASAAIKGSSAGHLDTRNSGYLDDGQRRSIYDMRRLLADARTYDLPTSSQLELMKQINPEATLAHEYISKLSLRDSDISSIQKVYSDFIPSDLLASTNKSVRDSDLIYSSLPVTQSLPSRYFNVASSTSSLAMSMPAVLKPAAFSLTEPSSVLPQHYSHPYSQRSLALEQLANRVGYPSPPHSHECMPPALQQAYPGTSAFNQPLASRKYSLPQHKREAAMSRLPLSAVNASGYGSFGTSTNNSESFLHNPSTVHTSSTSGYEDVCSQYEGGNHFAPFQQNNSFSAWDYGHGSRTLSPVRDSAYYSFSEQTKPLGSRTLSPVGDSAYYSFPEQTKQPGSRTLSPVGDSAYYSFPEQTKQLGSRTLSPVRDSAYYSFLEQTKQHNRYQPIQHPSQHYGAPVHPDLVHSRMGHLRTSTTNHW